MADLSIALGNTDGVLENVENALADINNGTLGANNDTFGQLGNEATGYEPPVAKIVFSLIICIVGLIGNAVVIFLILVLKEYKKSVTHWYVLQLALADSLFLISLPFQVAEDFDGFWRFSEDLCKAKETILFLNYYASIIFLAVMSLDRYIAVCHPFRTNLQKLREPSAAVIVTVVTWAVSLVICTPVILFSSTVGDLPGCICSFSFPPDPIDFDQICGFEQLSDEICGSVRDVIENAPSCRPADFLEVALAKAFENLLTGNGGPTIPEYGEYYSSLIPPVPGNETGSGTGSTGNAYAGGYDYGSYGGYGGYDYGNYGASIGSGDLSNTTDSNNETITPASPYATCSYEGVPSGFTGFLIFNFVVMFIVPFIIMSICYSLIVMRLRETRFKPSTPKTPKVSESGVPKRKKSMNQSDKDRSRITIMCVVLVGVFAFCWLPFHIFHMIRTASYEYLISTNVCQILPIIGTLLAYLNSAVNPYLYTFLGTNFARRFRKTSVIVRQSIRQKKSKSVTSNTGPGVKYAKNGSQDSSAVTGITKAFKSRDSSVMENKNSEVPRPT